MRGDQLVLVCRKRLMRRGEQKLTLTPRLSFPASQRQCCLLYKLDVEARRFVFVFARASCCINAPHLAARKRDALIVFFPADTGFWSFFQCFNSKEIIMICRSLSQQQQKKRKKITLLPSHGVKNSSLTVLLILNKNNESTRFCQGADSALWPNDWCTSSRNGSALPYQFIKALYKKMPSLKIAFWVRYLFR